MVFRFLGVVEVFLKVFKFVCLFCGVLVVFVVLLNGF